MGTHGLASPSSRIMFDHRRYLGTFAVFALVLLRLVIGWHFFLEGTQKVEYDHRDRQVRLDFSADGFLKGAKGPLAGLYHDQAPDDHGWQQLLASPRENVPSAEEPAYHAWQTQITDDWQAMLDDVKRAPGVTDEQRQQADAEFEARQKQLAGYLSSHSEEIAEYRHALWRLEKWRSSPEAREVPFVEERIAAKAAETSGQPGAWVREVRAIDEQFRDELRRITTAGAEGRALTLAAIDRALTDPAEKRLRIINVAVTVLTIAVGVCLLLGLFTRVASILGALFLVGVIASQPPWLYDSAPTMPQVIEFAGLLVLAGTGAGRWLGLDFFGYALVNRSRDRSEKE